MCGITGAIWTNPQKAISSETLLRMTEVLTHRGPDDEGTFTAAFQTRPPYPPQPGVALGFRRLSIIDVEGGRQPMCNEDGTVWVVFNGEIYNYSELRHRLQGAGHTFQTNSDTESIVHLYEDEGADCFSHLNGMFAIAIWDARHGQLVLGRDRLGQKPLIYRQENDRLLFASELKSLLQVPGVPREIDPSAIDEYLTYQYIPYPNTIFRGFRKLPPGHRAVFREGKLQIDAYWTPDFQVEQPMTESAAVERLTTLFRSSIEMRMRSDVPLGAFLSGGVDSSLVTAIMQELSDEPVKTFSIGFPIAEYDETRYARQVAQHLGTDHHEFQVTPDALEVLPKLIWHYDEPFADSSAIPTWYVSQLTSEHVTVSLTGDGGDELFAGYPRYKAIAVANTIDRLRPLRSLLGSEFWQRLPAPSRQKSRRRQFKRFSQALSKSPLRRYADWISIYNEDRRAALYSDDFVEHLPNCDPFDFLHAAWQRAETRDSITATSLTDLTTYLPCDLNHKVDIASMAHSLECRQPFLDHRVVELAAAMPIKLKFKRLRGKRVLQRAFGNLLPREIWKRKKMGFGVPIDHWLRNELRDLSNDVLLDETARSRNYFRKDAIERLLKEHQENEFDHAYRLWGAGRA